MFNDAVLTNSRTHCYIATTLSQDVDDGKVSDDISVEALCFCKVETCLVHIYSISS
jgi:hypothetical protein